MRVGPRLGTAAPVVLCAALLLGAGGSGAAAVDDTAPAPALPTTQELIDQVRADLAESSGAMVQSSA